jgi:hypothetical protein
VEEFECVLRDFRARDDCDFWLYAFWAVRDILETKEENPDPWTWVGDLLDIFVLAAAVWILVAGEVLWRKIGEKNPGKEELSEKRWELWKAKFKKIARRLDLKAETRFIAKRAVEKIHFVESVIQPADINRRSIVLESNITKLSYFYGSTSISLLDGLAQQISTLVSGCIPPATEPLEIVALQLLKLPTLQPYSGVSPASSAISKILSCSVFLLSPSTIFSDFANPISPSFTSDDVVTACENTSLLIEPSLTLSSFRLLFISTSKGRGPQM